MKKGFLVNGILALSMIGCSTPIINTDYDFLNLEKEYKSFSTKALSDAYVKRMFGKYLGNPVNSVQLNRQLEFSRYLKTQSDTSYETSLKNMFLTTPVLYDQMTGITAVSDKMTAESPTFGTYVIGLSPYPGVPVATSATNIGTSSFTANWNSVANATGYKLTVDGGTPIDIGLVTTYNVTGVTANSNHTYYVQSVRASIPSNNSNIISLSTISPTGEFIVNSTGYPEYYNDQSYPATAMDDNGNFVVTWQSGGNQDGSGFGIYAQRYNSSGIAQGTEFKVNSYTTGDQVVPSISMSDNGNFIITWQSDYALFAQMYNNNGTKLGSEFQINTYTTSSGQQNPSIAMNDNGNFVISWHGPGSGDAMGIFAQMFNNSGTKVGSEFKVNTYVTNDQTFPTTAIDPNGNFVISWASYKNGGDTGIYAQRYDNTGTKVGSEFRVSTYVTNTQSSPTAAMDNSGNFIISWTSLQDGSGTGIYAQRYDNSGTKVGSEFLVNTNTTGHQSDPSVSMNDNGNFIIAWGGYPQEGGIHWGIYAQRYNSSAVKLGTEFLVNNLTVDNDFSPSVAINNSNDFVVSWYKDMYASGTIRDIFGKMYDSNGNVK